MAARASSSRLHIYGSPFVRKARVSCDDEEPAHPRQGCDNLLGYAVRKVLLVTVGTQVIEWQDGYGRLIG
jgi:hypothetical protein